MISSWARDKLEQVKDRDRIVMRDSLRLLPEADGVIHTFARNNDFTVIIASTNLVFRELYEKARSAPETKKLLIVDRAPAGRRELMTTFQAPPPFYPDVLENISADTCIDLNLRQFLVERTNDPSWPQETNERRYARLISRHLEGVLTAHGNLRNADPTRFSDHDLETIVAYAALGVPEAAFKKMDATDYWRVGLLGHEVLGSLEDLVPTVTNPIREQLQKAPAPFCWFVDHDAETVTRALYLSLILSQHYDQSNILMAKVEPPLAHFGPIKPEILQKDIPKIIKSDPAQAARDIDLVEQGLSKDALQILLLDQIDLTDPNVAASVIAKEKYSSLIRSLALLMVLDNLLSSSPGDVHESTEKGLRESAGDMDSLVEASMLLNWQQLKEAYVQARVVQALLNTLMNDLKTLKVLPPNKLTFKRFFDAWNKNKTNRLEYAASCLERLVDSGTFLPRPEADLPSAFANALSRIRKQVHALSDKVNRQLNELNSLFQAFVYQSYASWVKGDPDVRLTSQFLSRCLKPNWDPQNEKAVVFLFDGMRYDIWEEFVRPVFEDRMDVLAEYPASSLLPSETHYSRKAISAGTFPDAFDHKSSEDKLLKEGLNRELNLSCEVTAWQPETVGTGETVRYRAGNLDVYIFDLCDSMLHDVPNKTLLDGRDVPKTPLSFIYQQMLKNIIDTEVTAIVRSLTPETKIFVVADHGFCRVARDQLRMESTWLNEPTDCAYRNAKLRQSLDQVNAHGKVKSNVWEFSISDVRLPSTEAAIDRTSRQPWQKQFASVIFPKVGYSLARPSGFFNPDAFTHGGISIQELMVPMIVLKVRDKDEGPIAVGEINGPDEVVEGQEAEFTISFQRTGKRTSAATEIRVNLHASYAKEPGDHPLPNQVAYVASKGSDAGYRFKPDIDATDEERLHGEMKRTLTITVAYQDGNKSVRKTRAHAFTVRLNSEKLIRRVPPALGNILGLTPKSLR